MKNLPPDIVKKIESTPGVKITQAKTLACADCKIVVPRNGPGQKYCETCSELRNAERHRKLAKANPQPKEYTRKQSQRQRSMAVARGAERSVPNQKNVVDITDAPPPLRWFVAFAVPFSYAASKNHIYRMGRGGHVFFRRESRDYVRMVEEATRKAVEGMRVVNAKVWVSIFAQKPDHRGDAVNVVDLVCDGIKKGIGVDDRWFCIRKLDWQVSKKEPRLIIGIGQSEGSHRQICSHCGKCLRLDRFRKRKHSKLGVSRACKKCLSSQT